MSDSFSSDPAKKSPWDPVFLHARREALVIFLVWLAALTWAVPFCYVNGYPDEFSQATFSTTLGVPTWLFWGIAVPWLVADLVTAWFCFGFMRVDELGAAPEETTDRDAAIRQHEKESSHQDGPGNGDQGLDNAGGGPQ